MEQEILEQIKKIEERLAKLEKVETQENQIIDKVDQDKLSFAGNYQSKDGSFGSKFGHNQIRISQLFEQDASEVAKIIDAFASAERVAIVECLMQKRFSAKELMIQLKFATTGKLYHHLSFLEKLGVVAKSNEQYYIEPRAIGSIVLIFASAKTLIKR